MRAHRDLALSSGTHLSLLRQCHLRAEPAAPLSLNLFPEGRERAWAMWSVLRLQSLGVGWESCGDNQGYLVMRYISCQHSRMRERPEKGPLRGHLGLLSQTQAAEDSWAPLKAPGKFEQWGPGVSP